MARLTRTELAVGELYSRGMKPREIARALGISINTVYKAISKYRKYLDGSGDMGDARLVTYSFEFSFSFPLQAGADVGALEERVRRLEERVRELENALRSGPPAAREPDEVGLPRYVRDNVWVNILRSRRG